METQTSRPSVFPVLKAHRPAPRMLPLSTRFFRDARANTMFFRMKQLIYETQLFPAHDAFSSRLPDTRNRKAVLLFICRTSFLGLPFKALLLLPFCRGGALFWQRMDSPPPRPVLGCTRERDAKFFSLFPAGLGKVNDRRHSLPWHAKRFLSRVAVPELYQNSSNWDCWGSSEREADSPNC